MALIAEECPRCKRLTRCVVYGGGSITGGLMSGIPFVIHRLSVQCACGECGQVFQGRPGVEDRALPPEQAAGLDIEELFARTNPDLQRNQIIAELRREPRLATAFALLDRLPPCPLHIELEAELTGWPSLDGPAQDVFLGRIADCDRAETFARAMSKRFPLDARGLLVGAVVAAGVWLAAWATIRPTSVLFWALDAFLGLIAGGLAFQWMSQDRSKRWVREELLPQAESDGVQPGWLLAVLDKTKPPHGNNDDAFWLRELTDEIREELSESEPAAKAIGFGPEG